MDANTNATNAAPLARVWNPGWPSEPFTVDVEHNHGHLVLTDARIEVRYGREHVVGTVVRGHTTSRLFSATSTKHETPGTEGSWPLFGKTPYERDAQGVYHVNCCFCG